MEYKNLLHQLKAQLSEIKKENQEIIIQANLSIIACRNILSNMNQIVLNDSFKYEENEIEFFKKIKIIPLTQLIYYSEISIFEIQYPKVSISEQKKYLEKRVHKLNKFFDYNIAFIQYIKEERTQSDVLYYTRKNRNSLNITNTKAYYRSPDFSTSHDILLGKVKANELLVIYLKNRLYNLGNLNIVNLSGTDKKSKLKWVSSKVALVELIYGLKSSGAIDAEINEIVIAMEELFNIKLSNCYRTFSEIKMRKINRTIFIDKMKDSLENRMDESDE